MWWWLVPLLAQAADVAPPRPDGPVMAVSPRHLVVTLPEGAAFSRDPAAWTLACGRDVVRASSVAVRTRPVDLVPEGWPYRVVVASDVILGFDAAVPSGECTVGDGEVAIEWDRDPAAERSPAIHLNQVGALPGLAHAAVSYWSPDERIDLSDARTYHVVDGTSGVTVLTGELEKRAVTADDAYGNDYTQADVWDADLSALGAGWYYLVWDGVGRSWSFEVADDAWDTPFSVAFRGLFHQRCGGPLDPALTDWPHGACHVEPVHQTSADYQIVGEDAFSALPAADLGTTVDAHGGWHDAADYDRNWGHLRVLDELVDLYELDPTLHGRDDLRIPESGNGIPDLLDEALWGLSTWTRLQAADGGVPGCVGTTAYPGLDEMPDADDGEFYACAPDPLATFRYAGAAARLSGALAGIDDATSADLLARARLAWTWAEANPRGYDTVQAAVYAAAALLSATGEPSWDAVFRERGPLADPDFALADWDGDEWDEALYVYARSDAADPATKDHAVRVLDGRAAAWVSWARGSAWRIVKHPYAPVTNGTVTTPVGAGLLIRAWKLTGNAEYREWASYGADATLGFGPSGWSWTTGLGDHPVRDPLQTPSLADGIPEPVPGITVYGPSYLTEGSDNVAVTLQAFDPPIASWPLLERYADVAYVPNMNEFTVTENVGPTLFAFGALASWATAPGGTDTGSPTADTDAPRGDTDGAATDAPAKGGCGCDAGGAAPPDPALLLGALALAAGRRRRGGERRTARVRMLYDGAVGRW